MLLDNIYGLLNLFEFKINHFNSLVQAKSEFKNSNFGGKYIEIMSSLMFSNKYDFSYNYYTSHRNYNLLCFAILILNMCVAWLSVRHVMTSNI